MASTEALKALLMVALGEGDHLQGDRAVLKILDQAQLEHMVGLLEFARRKKASSGEMLQRLVLMRWAELDPAVATEAAGNLRPLPSQVLKSIASEWAAKDPAAARDWVLSVPRGPRQLEAVIGFCRGLAKHDPAAALAWLSQSPYRTAATDAYETIFLAWASAAPASAAASAAALPSAQGRFHAIHSVSRIWADQAPKAALAWAGGLQRSSSTAAVQAIFEQWGRRDPRSAAEEALAMPEGPLRSAALGSVAYSIAEDDLEAAQALVAQVTSLGSRTQLMSAISRRLAESGPSLKGAFEYALSIPPGESRDEALAEIATWSRDDEDHAETASWLATHLPDDGRASEILGSKLQSWASVDPPAAILWALKADAARVSDDSLRQLASNWARDDPDGALRWVRGEAAASERAVVLAGAIDGLAVYQPARAAELLSQLPPGSAQEGSAMMIAGSWAAIDPPAAAEWVLRLPSGKARDNAAVGVVASWTAWDLANAAKWMERLPAGSTRDSAVAYYSAKVVSTDPQGAASWAATITDAASARMRCDECTKGGGA
jgi:hypothetical protein